MSWKKKKKKKQLIKEEDDEGFVTPQTQKGSKAWKTEP